MPDLPSDLAELLRQALEAVGSAAGEAELEDCRTRYLGRKSVLNQHLRGLGGMPPEQRRARGGFLHQIKEEVGEALARRREELQRESLQQKLESGHVDTSLPGRGVPAGRRHPISLSMERASAILARMGFAMAHGAEIEDEEHNFTALNIPEGHPAKASHDTFYLQDGRLLRTHTSPVQVRYMRKHPPPLRMISAGRVYRRDQDSTHSPMFCQLEGLMVDRNVSFAGLKWALFEFMGEFFERKPRLRFRPSYFPFTEPSAEVDLWDGSRWLEVLGCGMVHRNVLEGCGIDSDEYTGFAFGVGLERLAMLRYGVSDLHLLYENDMRFLAQISV